MPTSHGWLEWAEQKGVVPSLSTRFRLLFLAVLFHPGRVDETAAGVPIQFCIPITPSTFSSITEGSP
ncbi:MAG: hypothetical protein HQL72_05080 [Magnetococcales bacterium]|nr:hypothetical protein [Magnetococcales bacterium]